MVNHGYYIYMSKEFIYFIFNEETGKVMQTCPKRVQRAGAYQPGRVISVQMEAELLSSSVGEGKLIKCTL